MADLLPTTEQLVQTLRDADAGKAAREAASGDDVKTPSHYFATLADGTVVECRPLIRALGLNWWLGNVLKYIWRAGRKTPDKLKDLRKARELLDDEITALEREESGK
jgi:hypothetical protein